MSEQCVKHHFDMAEGQCRRCGYLFCGRCLVFSRGPSKPPYCLSCAVAAAGIRSNAGNIPIASRRELRQAEKLRRKAERAEAKGRRQNATPDAEPAQPGVIPAPSHPVPSRSPAAGWHHVA